MKKTSLFILTLLLMIPFCVFADDDPKVLTLNAEANENIISYEGTTEDGAHAVMCKLLNSSNEEIDKLSVAVNNMEFTGSFTTTATGNYKVTCANYEGGAIKEANVSIVASPTVYTVTFNSSGGSQVDSAEVLAGQKVVKPTPDPTNGDKIFGGWFEDDTFTKEFDFDTPITEDIELFALWTDPETVRVDFDTRCEQGLEPIEILSGEKVVKPTPDPTNGDKIFSGWFEDDTFTKEFDFDTPVTSDITLYALWTDPEIEKEEYVVTDESGNSVEFTEEEEHIYTLNIIDYLSYTKEEVIELSGVTEEEYDELFNEISNAVKNKGTLISMLDITVTDELDVNITEGPITIKIKLTDEMKKYNTLKLIYVKDDFTTENPISLNIEGDYAVGILPHLSVYTLVGSNTGTSGNPQTSDNIYIWYGLFIISVLGLSVGTLTARKFMK